MALESNLSKVILVSLFEADRRCYSCLVIDSFLSSDVSATHIISTDILEDSFLARTDGPSGCGSILCCDFSKF